MVTSQILKSVDFIKTQKSKYLEDETFFSLIKKKIINYTLRAASWQKNVFLLELTFKSQNLLSLMLFFEDALI